MTQSSIRVLHITASSKIGGGPEHVWQLVRHLPSHIHSYIAAPCRKPYEQRFIAAVGQDRFLEIPQRKFTLNAFWQLVKCIKHNKIDIIHSHGKGAGFYGRLAALCTGVRSVHTFHGIHLPQSALFRTLYKMLERFLCSVSKMCIAVSMSEYQEAQRLGFIGQNLQVVPNGVFVPKALLQKKLPSPFSILHVSRFDRVKNSLAVHDIAMALQKKQLLDACHFVIVGEGSELQELQRLVISSHMAEKFSFEGVCEQVQPLYEQAACLLSTSFREGMPLAVLEAQAFGVPVIATDVVGNNDAVKDGETGFLFPLQDTNVAVSYLQRLMQDENLWQDMRQKSYARVKEKFSVHAMAQAYADVYVQTMKV